MVHIQLCGRVSSKKKFTQFDILAHAFSWKNLGECICTDLLFLDWFSSYNFFLPFYLNFENATYSIFVKDVPMTPIKHTRKHVS